MADLDSFPGNRAITAATTDAGFYGTQTEKNNVFVGLHVMHGIMWHALGSLRWSTKKMSYLSF